MPRRMNKEQTRRELFPKAQNLEPDSEGVKSGLNFEDVRRLKVFNSPLSLQEEFAPLAGIFNGCDRDRRECQVAAGENMELRFA